MPAVVISALSLAGLSAALMIQADRVARRSLEAKVQSMASFLEKASVTYLINFDLSALETFTKQVVKDSDFVFAVFLDDKNKPLTPPVAPEVEVGALVVTQKVTDAEGKLLATFNLGYTPRSIAANFRRTLVTSLTGFLFAQFLLTIGLGWVARSITRKVGEAARTLEQSTDEITNTAEQMQLASSSVAAGSSSQAGSIEETSASLEELASMTKRNAESAHRANELVRQTRTAAEKGVTNMSQMSAAMEAIQVSSDDIAKIIKTIDEIAFQTNILALNAAVEAARAGEAGMGFAVVADEVRALAQRSAKAAKETAEKIDSAITKTAQGVEISVTVSAALNDIVTKARQVDELAAEVAGASREQTQGITQINGAVGQMDKVTQNNAANAEETAAAAQELNAQAQVVKKAVDGLQELCGLSANTTNAPAPVSARSASASPARSLPKAGKHLPNHTQAQARGTPVPNQQIFRGAPVAEAMPFTTSENHAKGRSG